MIVICKQNHFRSDVSSLRLSARVSPGISDSLWLLLPGRQACTRVGRPTRTATNHSSSSKLYEEGLIQNLEFWGAFPHCVCCHYSLNRSPQVVSFPFWEIWAARRKWSPPNKSWAISYLPGYLNCFYMGYYFLIPLPDLRERMGGHIFYISGLCCRCIALWTLIHFTADTHNAKRFCAPKTPGVPAVKKCLSSLFLRCLLNSECPAPWLRCTQQLVIPVTRILAPGLSSDTQGGFFCRGEQQCALMLSVDMVMTVGTTVMRITTKSVNSATIYSNRTKKDDRDTLKPGPRVASLRLFQQKKKNHAQASTVLNVTGQEKAHATFQDWQRSFRSLFL